MGALDGITVVALEQAVAAPFATRQLADLGARVIKIERPGSGDFARAYDTAVHGMSSHFVWLNRSKQSLTLDLKRPEASAALRRLIARADVFVQNLAPGAAERLGLGTGALRQAHPRLIACSVSGYGNSGPYRDRKAYDLLVQAESGVMSITGTPDECVKLGIPVADLAAGMYAYTGILTALYARERTGDGAAVEVSMLEALGEWMGFPLHYTVHGGTPPPRSGAHHATIAPYGPYACAGGQAVLLGIQNEREWLRFCADVLRRPALASDPRFDTGPGRAANREALDREIHAVFSALRAAAVIERLDAAGIANASLNTVEQFADHPQLAARDRWRDVATGAGPARSLVPPATIDGAEPRMDAVPALGAHTASILEELGYDAATVAAWRKAGIA